jgi:hypothetical protein
VGQRAVVALALQLRLEEVDERGEGRDAPDASAERPVDVEPLPQGSAPGAGRRLPHGAHARLSTPDGAYSTSRKVLGRRETIAFRQRR